MRHDLCDDLCLSFGRPGSTSSSMEPPDLTLSPGIPPNDSPRTSSSEFEQGCFLQLLADVALTSDDPDPRKRQIRSLPPRDHPQSIRPAPSGHAKQQRSDRLCSYLDNRGQLFQVDSSDWTSQVSGTSVSSERRTATESRHGHSFKHRLEEPTRSQREEQQQPNFWEALWTHGQSSYSSTRDKHEDDMADLGHQRADRRFTRFEQLHPYGRSAGASAISPRRTEKHGTAQHVRAPLMATTGAKPEKLREAEFESSCPTRIQTDKLNVGLKCKESTVQCPIDSLHLHWQTWHQMTDTTGMSIYDNMVTTWSVGTGNEFNVHGLARQVRETPKRPTPKPAAKLIKYSCVYCGQIKVSASTGQDGRIRIRCECGGKRRDNSSRVHAMWNVMECDENDARRHHAETSRTDAGAY